MDDKLRKAMLERMHEERETNDSRFVRKTIRYYLEDKETPEMNRQDIADLEVVLAAKRQKLNALESEKPVKEDAKDIIPPPKILGVDEQLEADANRLVEYSIRNPDETEYAFWFEMAAIEAQKHHPDINKDDYNKKLEKRFTEIKFNKS